MFTTLLDLKLINVETYYFRVESQNAYGHVKASYIHPFLARFNHCRNIIPGTLYVLNYIITVLCCIILVMDTPELRDRLPDIEMNIRTVGAGILNISYQYL